MGIVNLILRKTSLKRFFPANICKGKEKSVLGDDCTLVSLLQPLALRVSLVEAQIASKHRAKRAE